MFCVDKNESLIHLYISFLISYKLRKIKIMVSKAECSIDYGSQVLIATLLGTK